MSGRTLVAGVGNVFLRDDAFGVEVAALHERAEDDGPPASPRERLVGHDGTLVLRDQEARRRCRRIRRRCAKSRR